MKRQEKTNVMRLLDQKKVSYKSYDYTDSGVISGIDVAAVLGQDPLQVFKTLVTVGASGKNYVFVIPVCSELNLKEAAKSVGEKSIAMLKAKELLPLTGYIHGGCSPIGMKKPYPTFIHESALLHDYIYISAGVRGLQIKISPNDLFKFVGADIYPI